MTVALAAGLLGLYLVAVVRVRAVAGRRWSRRRVLSMLVAAVLVALAAVPGTGAQPVSSHAHPHGDVAVAHVQQHLLLGMVAPVFLVPAAPVSLLLAASPVRWRPAVRAVLHSRWTAALTHPGVTVLPVVGGLYLLHLSPLYAAGLDDERVHHLLQVHFLLSGWLFTWSLVGADPAPARSRLGVRLGVLVVAAGAHAYLAKTLYARAPDLPPGSPHDVEQTQQAALWLYYGGDAAELLLATALFGVWYRHRGKLGQRMGLPPVTAMRAPET